MLSAMKKLDKLRLKPVNLFYRHLYDKNDYSGQIFFLPLLFMLQPIKNNR